MVDKPSRISPTRKATESLRSQQKLQAKKLANRNLQRVASARNFEEWCESGFNVVTVRKNFKALEEFKGRKAKEAQKENEDEVAIIATEKAEEAATRFQNKNNEFDKKSLLLLRDSLKEDDTSADILKKVLDFYPDPTLADEALDFLYETTYGNLQREVFKAKEELNAQFDREIKAGKNIRAEAKQYAEIGLGSASNLRDLYRDVTGTVRTTEQLFNELSDMFNYSQLKSAIKFIFHSLGSDLNSKGPSIPRAELLKLVDDVKSLQAILGVYKFFEGRMEMVNSHFLQNNLKIPPSINFEILAKIFVKIIESRYMSSDKILQLAKILGLDNELLSQIIVFNQFRDAVRGTAPKLYKSNKHRQEIIDAILEALEEIEEKREEEEEENNEK